MIVDTQINHFEFIQVKLMIHNSMQSIKHSEIQYV